MARITSTYVMETRRRLGAVLSLKTRYVVDGVIVTDESAILDAISEAGVPSEGDRHSAVTTDSGYELMCSEVSAKRLSGGDGSQYEVNVLWENCFRTDVRDDDMDSPAFTHPGQDMRCTIQQKETGEDKDGNVLGFYSGTSSTLGGSDTEFNFVTVNFFHPQRSFTVRGIKETDKPWLLANSITGHLNSVTFAGGAPKTWLCSAVNWSRHSYDGGDQKHLFEIEFSYDPDGWNPKATYSKNPNSNLTLQTIAYQEVEIYPEADFESLLGFPIVGG